ncbi:hypothetical protein VB735_24870 [Halotia wernerae UHCC 0503]|nr:hypothetical protein [Halotia wernerae UHCC 0503]
MARYLEDWGGNFNLQMIILSYKQLVKIKNLPVGTYIFSDIERLTPEFAETLALVWKQLSNAKDIRLLNHPTRSMKRYELLRNLYELGWNNFNVYWLTEFRVPKMFPVFIRVSNDHNSLLTSLLNSVQELNAAINKFLEKGESREDKIITEFCDTSNTQGIFKKYSAFIIGECIIPCSISFGYDWFLKGSLPYKEMDEAMRKEETEYLEKNPHESYLRKIFNLARIDYVRIDYSLLNGKIQTWEINTNPSGLYTIEEDKNKIVCGLPINEYLSKKIALAFENINSKTNPMNQILISKKNNSLQEITREIKLILKSSLPYPLNIMNINMLKNITKFKVF